MVRANVMDGIAGLFAGILANASEADRERFVSRVREDEGKDFDPLAFERKRAEWMNQEPGELTGYDCPLCLNRGGSMVVLEDGSMVFRPCKCMAIRQAKAGMERCGIPRQALDKCRLEKWKVEDAWQADALRLAKEYIALARDRARNRFSNWFVMCGTPGSGKTTLCTAVLRELLESGMEGRYLSWREFARDAKALANSEEFSGFIRWTKETPLLYIDDFWKGKNVTAADISLAFEILNNRYSDPDKLTIVSSEWTVDVIMRGDQALGSRLLERAGTYYIDCSKARNWRLRGREHHGAG